MELLTIIGVSIALAGLILATVRPLSRDVADIRERLGRIEGRFAERDHRWRSDGGGGRISEQATMEQA